MILRLALLFALLIQTGCATILGHNDHPMKVTSQPAGATVYLNGAPVGQTPLDFEVKDLGTPNTLRVRLEGYEDETERVMRKVQTVAFCNLFSILCWGVDYLSDSMFEIKNDTLHFDLRGLRGPLPAPGPIGPAGPIAPGVPTGPRPPAVVSPGAPVEAIAPEAPEPEFEPPPELSPPPLVPPSE